MKTPSRFVSLLVRLSLLLPALCLFPCLTSAQGSAVGTVEGRVLNPESGEYLESVRITVEGTLLEAFTDTSGEYRLTNVPAGSVTLKAFRTGAVTQTQVVSVAAGQIAVQHFNLTGVRTTRGGDDTVKLDAFVVATSKEMDGAAIAINTQRFASNVVNIVSANEFGPVADGGVGEVLKSMPGIAITRGGFGDAYTITMNGVPPNNVPVTIGGFNLANASSDTSRAVGMQQVSINNFSRIEVIHTPTPESSGSALAGSVNMVPISAFERSRPVFNISVSAMFRDNEHSLEKTPGPLRQPERKVHPALDFSAIVPVNKRFGFTFSGSASSLYTAQSFSQMGWRGGGLATNGGTLPDTTAGAPYLTDYAVADRPRQSSRVTLGTTLDYRITSNDRLSFSFQYGFSDAQHYDRTLNFSPHRIPVALRMDGENDLTQPGRGVDGQAIYDRWMASPLAWSMTTHYGIGLIASPESFRFKRRCRERGAIAFAEQFARISPGRAQHSAADVARAMRQVNLPDADGKPRIRELSSVQAFYWTTLMLLDWGFSYISLYGTDHVWASTDETAVRAMEFVNKYAGWHNEPARAPGAWTALGRFVSKRGAGENANWGFFLSEENSGGSTEPVNFAGGEKSTQGVWARRLTGEASFALDPAFAGSLAGKSFLRVCWLNEPGAALHVTAGGKKIATLASDASGQWRDACLEVPAGTFSGGGRARVTLTPTQGKPAIHLIEVSRES